MFFARPEDFTCQDRKSLTLLGMSGVGKTTIARKLIDEGWFHFSGDYRIGTRYLADEISDEIKLHAKESPYLSALLKTDSIHIASNITVDNLLLLSAYLGKLGDPARGGHDLEEFRRRQALFHEAEVRAILDAERFRARAKRIYGYDHFLLDVGGSLCEVLDSAHPNQAALDLITKTSLLLYIEAGEEREARLVEVAAAKPKPMYYSDEFLEKELKSYCGKSFEQVDAREIDPDDFIRYVFPKLMDYRRGRYKAIALAHGYTISSEDFRQVETYAELEALVCKAIAEQTPAWREAQNAH